MKTIHEVFVLVLVSICLSKINAVELSQLARMGVNCQNRISCDAMGRSNFTARNCECDSQCVTYQDCCIDARSTPSQTTNSINFGCMPYGNYSIMGAYVIETCSTNYNGPRELQTKCLDRDNISDPVMSAPVTDTVTRTSYRSRYCAECNNADAINLKSWVIDMVCVFTSKVNVDNNFIYDNIYYNRNLNQWKIDLNGRSYPCELKYDMPDYALNKVRLCRPNVISTCPSTWIRRRIKRECESYTAVMYAKDGSAAYRNPHCAICNGLTVDEIACTRGIFSRKKKPFSLPLIMDWNQKDGDVVGVSTRAGNCGANQKYDPYGKKCRNLYCALPGYERINGRCRKRS